MGTRDLLATSTQRLKDNYWPLIKSRQTFLLTLTGAAGYLCGQPFPMDWLRFSALLASMLLTIGGCTSLNMVCDRDIDRKMERTRLRPLPSGQVNAGSAAGFGGALILAGLLIALSLSGLFFWLALAGIGVDLLVYTLWLKRRSAWSILWGGIAGGIPILAGRALVTGQIDATGLLLGLAILCWIPGHNLTLAMLHSEDYLQAGLPTFLNTYGLPVTRGVVAGSNLATLALIAAAFTRLAPSLPEQVFLGISGLGLIGVAICAWGWSSRRAVLVLYKTSSFYLLAAMVLLAATAFS